MKKSLLDIVRACVPVSDNIRISENNYTDYYFRSGFTAPGVFIGFDFFGDSDRKNYDSALKALHKKKSLYVGVIKHTGCVAGVVVWFSSDAPTIHLIENEKWLASDAYWEKDHALRVAGVSDEERNEIMRIFDRENVRAFLDRFSKVKRIA